MSYCSGKANKSEFVFENQENNLNVEIYPQFLSMYYRISMHTDQRELQEFMKSQFDKAVNEVHTTISVALDTIDEIYSKYNIRFHFQKEAAHRTFMSIVTPVDINFNSNVEYSSIKPTSASQRHQIEENQQTKTLESRLTKLSQKIVEYKEKQRYQETPSAQNKPQMMSILNQIKTSRDQGNSHYYKRPVDQKNEKTSIKFKKSSLTYPALRMEDEDEEGFEVDKEKCTLGSRVEQQINKWVVKEISKGKRITRHQLALKAVSLRENPAFKASRTWISSYFRRYPEIKNLITSCQLKPSSSSSSQEEQPRREVSTTRYYAPEYESFQEQLNGHKKYKQNVPAHKAEEDDMKQEDKAVYEDGEKKIIIYKGITNEAKQSKYTSGRRNRKSYVNGNGYNFKNHSRFKDAYFSDLNKSKQVNSVIIVKNNQNNETNKPKADDQNRNKKLQQTAARPETKHTQIENEELSERNPSRSRRKNNDYDSKLKSYLNLMKYQTIRTKQ